MVVSAMGRAGLHGLISDEWVSNQEVCDGTGNKKGKASYQRPKESSPAKGVNTTRRESGGIRQVMSGAG